MNDMELWEAFTLTNELGYTDRSLWESSRLIAYIIAQCNSKKKLTPQDIIKFEWEVKARKNTKSLTKAEVLQRAEAFKKTINNG